MRTLNILVIAIIILANSCAPWKDNLKEKGSQEVAINNAIVDFLNTHNSVEEFNTFHIIKVHNESTLGISILGDTNKWRLGKLKVGDTNEYFPTKFKEIRGNLFYWNDANDVLNQDMIDIMRKYDILNTLEYPNYGIPAENSHSYSKGAIHYFFCKTNYLKYKKVKTTVSIGYYKPPNLNCE